MKKKTLGRIAVFAFALCMVSTCLLSGTLAKYASSTTGTGTVNVAQWTNFKFQNGSVAEATFDFNLASTKTENGLVKSDQIAPGDKGSFTFTIGPAEVEYSYTAVISGTIPVSFYSDAEMTNEWTGASQRVSLANAETVVTKTVYWKWTEGTDASDTTLGIGNDSSTFTITLSAVQELTPAP